MALLATERRLSGNTLSQSTPMVRPKPRQVSQAPRGLLKLNSPGVGSRKLRSQCGQWSPFE
jgi:hypothetical protein